MNHNGIFQENLRYDLMNCW